jgi:hypothetical protein
MLADGVHHSDYFVSRHAWIFNAGPEPVFD